MKLHIINIDDVEFVKNKQINYSYAFHMLFKQLDESADIKFEEVFKQKFGMNDIEYRSLCADVVAKRKQEDTRRETISDDIEDIEDDLKDETDKKKRYGLWRKMMHKKSILNNVCVFGGRTLLAELTKEYNRPEKDLSKIEKLTQEYKNARIMMFSVMGEANQKGNRFFDFSLLDEERCVYKPFKGKKIIIDFSSGKNQHRELQMLKNLSDTKDISISVSLSTDYICLTYDEEKLNGFAVNDRERRIDVKQIKERKLDKEREKELIRACYKEYYDDQKKRKLYNKNPNRVVAIDMNPDNIGCSILEKINDDWEYKILKTWCYDFSYFFIKRGFASSDPRQKRLNNKRKYELCQVVKQIFRIATHYQCGYFIVEELDVKKAEKTDLNKESRRKINNLWSRDLLKQLITKRCNETGIILEEINPCYTSFIGNIQHPYGDSCSASIEIGRRGMFKYTKGGFYPHITQEDRDTLVSLYDNDASCSTVSDWVTIHKSLKETFGNQEFQYRFRTANVKATRRSFRMKSYKSRIITINYLNL